MTVLNDVSKELDRIHANHQLRIITSRLAEEIDELREQQEKIRDQINALANLKKDD